MIETATDGAVSAESPASENSQVDTRPSGALFRLFRLVLILYSIVFALRFFAWFWWLADLFSHFALQGFCSGIVLILLGACLRRKKLVLVTCLMTGLYGFELLPYFPILTNPPDSPAVKTLLAWNVYVGNPEKAKLIEAIRAVDADYVLLFEIDEGWDSELASLEDKYPVRYSDTEGAFGVAFLSREPVESLEIEDRGEMLMNTVVARLPEGVTLYGIHVLPPRGAAFSRIRNQQLDDLMQAVEATSGPLIVAGDLNLTPFSPHFSKLTASGRLRDIRRGRGLINSWPAGTVIDRIPIDHILPSPEIEVHSFERTADTCGSDHFGLLFRFSVRK